MYSHADALSWDGLCSHRVRLVLSEKDIAVNVVVVAEGEDNQELIQLNPAGKCPTMVDRELALYDARVIIDYLDERYPHPAFMPVDPVSRARTRLALHRIESDWLSLLPGAPGNSLSDTDARSALLNALTLSNDVFAAMPFFLSEEYSILDAALAPMLWRLGAYGINLPGSASAVREYAKRMTSRSGFVASLDKMESEMVQ